MRSHCVTFGPGVSDLQELRQLREEVGRLKRLVAGLSLDRQILQEIVSSNYDASCDYIGYLPRDALTE